MSENVASKEVTVEAVCVTCSGSGIIHDRQAGFTAGAVCEKCMGKGSIKLTYAPFIDRKRVDDITTVGWSSRGTRALARARNEISYEEFLAGKMPAK